MAKTKYYLCGVIDIQDKLFLIRPIKENLDEVPFAFPGLQVKKSSMHDVEQLKLAIRHKYQGEIEVHRYIGQHEVKNKKTRFVLRAYHCTLTKNVFLPLDEIDYRFAPYAKVLNLKFDDIDLLVAKQYILFRQAINGELSFKPRSEKEFYEIDHYLDVLMYFVKKIPTNIIEDFNDLTRSNAKMEQIRLAMEFILGVYNLKYREFLDYEKKRKKKRRK